jgi:hypothetical protein
MGLRCLTARISDREVRYLISTGYLSLESSGSAAYVGFALETWISDHLNIRQAEISLENNYVTTPTPPGAR